MSHCFTLFILLGQNPELIHPSHRSLNSLRRRPRRRSPRRRRPHAAVAYAAAAHAAAAHATAARDAAARVTEARVAAARAAAVRAAAARAAAARAAAITLARATTAHGRNSRRSSPHRHSLRQRSPRRHRPRRRSPRLSQPANSKPAPPEPTPPPLAAASPAGQRVATSGELSLPPLQWSGPKPRVAGPVWPGASVADLSTKLEPFFRARPPHKFSSAGRRHARPAAGAEKNQAPRQTADFIKKLGHLARVPACCAGQHLQHLVQLAASAALSAQRQLAKHTDCSVDLLGARAAQRRAKTVWARRVHGGARKALLRDRGL